MLVTEKLCLKFVLTGMERLKMAEQKQQASFLEVVITCAIIMFIFVGCNNLINGDNTTKQESRPTQTEQAKPNNKEEINQIEGYIREFQKAGIFMKVTDLGTDEYGKAVEIQVNEYAWNNLDYDTKKAAENMFLRYWEVGRVTVIFRGYRTGQKLYSISKNFKI